MSQTDKDAGVPLEVKPHPPPIKRTSSPTTMSHPAFAAAYINAPPQQYAQYVSSPTYTATTYPTTSEHWQRSPQQYANMPTNQYYTTSLQMGPPEIANGAYVAQYSQWMPPPSI
ncbi:SubName: Full=Uncharacterized protein {ECO:0000313/EMBL:CCA69989.1} [Serendipita indica DSM 11827]|nr:SubName: Full=Uncharacterized protein {ECO:0000313/EMBL:CCA69989.1} [Serendipita indica DSM 11827]